MNLNLLIKKDISAVSIVLTCKNKENDENIINGLDMLDEDTIVSFGSDCYKKSLFGI